MIVLLFGIFWTFRHYAGCMVKGNIYFGSLLVSMMHSSAVILLCVVNLAEKRGNVFLPNEWDGLLPVHYVLISFSAAYFLSDLYVVIYIKYSFIFVSHHLLVLLGLGCFWHFGEGAFLLTWLCFLGEVTNPVQNLCEMYRQIHRMNIMKDDDQRALWYRSLRRFFCVYFFVVRIVLLPWFVEHCLEWGCGRPSPRGHGSSALS